MFNWSLSRKVVAIAIALGVATALSVATPAQAATQRVVYVDSAVPSLWPVYTAVEYTDRFTGTNMVYGHCRPNYGCIRIRESWYLNWNTVGITYIYANGIRHIYLNGLARQYGWRERRHLLVHELGHANGIIAHNSRCDSVMYWNMQCRNGQWSGSYFTWLEQQKLASVK